MTASATATIREWAVANGFTVSARGRISAEVMEAYKNRGAGAGAADNPSAEGRRPVQGRLPLNT